MTVTPNRIHNSGKQLKPKLKPVAIRQSKARLKALINKLKD